MGNEYVDWTELNIVLELAPIPSNDLGSTLTQSESS